MDQNVSDWIIASFAVVAITIFMSFDHWVSVFNQIVEMIGG